jgi:hypothetical protein
LEGNGNGERVGRREGELRRKRKDGNYAVKFKVIGIQDISSLNSRYLEMEFELSLI